MSLSKAKQKLIRSLSTKKGRRQELAFIVEGEKMVDELIDSGWPIVEIFATEEWKPSQSISVDVTLVTDAELKQVSQLTTPNQVLAIARLRQDVPPSTDGCIIALDRIQDPGNLGTIIRTAAWFGIDEVWCLKGTVDPFNPKVVQATMGGLFKVNVHIIEESLLEKAHQPIYILDMDGDDLLKADLPKEGIYVLGNEGEGIADHLKEQADRVLSISGTGNMESLNVAISAGILMSRIHGTP